MANLLSTSVTGTVNSTGNMTAAGFTGNANVGGTGAATWHPSGIYVGSTQWLYGTQYRNNSSTSGQGQLYFDGNYGYGMVGLYDSTRYQAVFAMGDSYKLPVDGSGTGTLYGIAWTHTNVGGQSKAGLGHQALFMMDGRTYTAIGAGIWTDGTITTTSHGTSANWNTAYGWGNHASAGYLTSVTNISGNAATATYATTAGSAPNGSNSNSFYNVTAGNGNGIKFWDSDAYKISMGNSSLYQYGTVTDYSIKTQMNDADPGRGFTWGRISTAPIASLNATSGNMQIAGTFSASNFSGTSSGTNTGDQTNISGNAATATTATTANNLAANTSPTIQVLNFTGVGTNSGNANQSYAIYQEGGAWSPPFPDLCIGYHTGIKLGAYFGYNGTRFYNNSDFATQTFSVNDGDNHVRVAYNLYVGGTISGSNLSGTNTGDQTNISGNAATATNVAWTGVTGRPTAVSQFTNDSGYITSPGNITRLWAESHAGDYYIRNNWTGTHWHITSNHGSGVRVAYADEAGTAENSNYINSNRGTPSNSLQYWQTSGLGIDEAPTTDWHNTIRMGHGSPLSYYSNTLAIRMTGSGVGDIYTQTIMNGSRQGWKKHWNDVNLTNLNQLTNGPGYITSSGSISGNAATATTATTAARATRANGNFYIDDNYGNTVVGVYSASRLQGVFAMGDAYKLAADGSSAADHYGIAWSHPNAGGTAARLTNHGMLVQGAGQTWTAISDSIWCIGDITAFSDARVKANVEVIDNPLERLSKVRGVTFTRIDLADPTKRYAGVIAQEMREALPEVVTEDGNGELSVSYGNTVSLLIESIKAQQAQIEELKLEVKKLKGE